MQLLGSTEMVACRPTQVVLSAQGQMFPFQRDQTDTETVSGDLHAVFNSFFLYLICILSKAAHQF